jgi:hypothetical protein
MWVQGLQYVWHIPPTTSRPGWRMWSATLGLVGVSALAAVASL